MRETIEWIACSERLPADQETVLFCAVDLDGVRYILQGWHEGGEWYGVDDPKPFPSALYWAAWPAGPRG